MTKGIDLELFYKTQIETNKAIAALGASVDIVINNQEHFQKAHADLIEKDKDQQDDIDALKVSDKKWGVVGAVISAFFAGLVALFKS